MNEWLQNITQQIRALPPQRQLVLLGAAVGSLSFFFWISSGMGNHEFQMLYKGLTEEEKSVAASVLWLLSGDAGQRALVAWSMDWAPAREASGENWMAPFLGQLLEDPYDAVRFIAYRSLRSQPGFSDLANDFLLPPEKRQEQVRRANKIWASQLAKVEHASGESILINTDGSVQWDVFRRLLAKRDETRVFLGE